MEKMTGVPISLPSCTHAAHTNEAEIENTFISCLYFFLPFVCVLYMKAARKSDKCDGKH